MRVSLGLPLVSCLAAALAVLAACGGGGEDPASSAENAELLVSNPSQALGASADRFADQVESVRSQFTMSMEATGIEFGADGWFAYQAPDSVHMTMTMSGGDETFDLGDMGDFEMLGLGDEIYVKAGRIGWMKASLDDLGAEGESFRQLLEGHAPLDYQQLVEDIGAQVEYLGNEVVNGRTLTKLRITADMRDVIDELTGSSGTDLFDPEMLAGGFSGPITMEVLLDPATLLPYHFNADATIGLGGEMLDLTMSFRFFDYNLPVAIPEPPPDAIPYDAGFDEAFGELTIGD